VEHRFEVAVLLVSLDERGADKDDAVGVGEGECGRRGGGVESRRCGYQERYQPDESSFHAVLGLRESLPHEVVRR
jgi:hypothetical protein